MLFKNLIEVIVTLKIRAAAPDILKSENKIVFFMRDHDLS